MVKIFPFIFIILWSSAFVTTKPIIDNSDPFTALAFRFFIGRGNSIQFITVPVVTVTHELARHESHPSHHRRTGEAPACRAIAGKQAEPSRAVTERRCVGGGVVRRVVIDVRQRMLSLSPM